MGLRLFRRARPAPPSAGRHARVVAGPTVPGAAATIVASAVPWEHAGPSPVRTLVAPIEAPTVTSGTGSGAPTGAERVLAGVSLGFSDGAQVDLAPDDPRARPFRAAAAALLEHRA